MELFGLSKRSLLEKINEGLKNPIKEEHIFGGNIKVSHLKKIDKIFGEGLSFYTDPKELKREKNASIFFRKTTFNSTITLGGREIVHKMETRIHSLSALSKLSNYKASEKLDTFNLNDPPEEVAKQIRGNLYPKEIIQQNRDFLKALIENFAEHNILVLEFVETWNKKNKANIDGFFIAPNNIVIKRQQGSLKREIFTLIHELGHYLLQEEELDDETLKTSNNGELNEVEKWCNEFAFAFLSKDFQEKLPDIFKQEPNCNNKQIKTFSQKYHISRLAIFTYLFGKKAISWNKYYSLKQELEKEQREREQKKESEREHNREMGIHKKGRSPKPIYSPLEKDIYLNAYFEGVVGEYEVLSHFKEKDIDRFIYE